jgi:uncharacterized membrane protein
MGDYSMQGHSSVLMLPIYGATVLLEPLFELYKGSRWYSVRFVVYGLVIITAEYYFGRLYNALGICPWDYSGCKYSINGIIRMDYLPLWCLVGAMYEGVYHKFKQTS